LAFSVISHNLKRGEFYGSGLVGVMAGTDIEPGMF
jgi:hypothetical protein